MDLNLLGWNDDYKRLWKKEKNKNYYPARVSRQDRKEFEIISEFGVQRALSRGKLHTSDKQISLSPVVGDWVAVSKKSSEPLCVIHSVLPRQSSISRKVAGSITRQQLLAANIDIIFLINSLDKEINLRRIERYLTQAWGTGARPVIILNKADLTRDKDGQLEKVRSVAGEAAVHAVSALSDQGLAAITGYFSAGKTVSFMGPSGVGKSTIVNRLLGTEKMKVKATHEATGEGRHTTTHRELIVLPDGGLIIDMPGIREIQLWGDEEKLKGSFADVDQLSKNCRFRNCRHQSEPGCAVLSALETGTLSAERYGSYLKLKEEFSKLQERKKQMTWKSPRRR